MGEKLLQGYIKSMSNMIIKLIRIKIDLLKQLRKSGKFKEIFKIFEKFEKLIKF